MSKKLQLHKETIRDLSEDALGEVAGGAGPTANCTITQSPLCPSGATWYASCESNIGTCG
ncbi:MAG TPA: class I lanthipeptide [Actinomycetota bacterium]|nr:class I lanthipeptide [Actinomycetota bacterium]